MNLTLDQPPAAVAGQIRAAYRDDGYVAYHAPRYARVLALLADYLPADAPALLDVGRSRLTEMIADAFSIPVDSLGFPPDQETPTGRHFRFDLNDAQHEARWRRDLPAYDVVLLAEVIEHLHTAPTLVLGFLKTLLKPGGVLIIQTPNAAALHKRLALLAGRNPYQRIKEDATDPGHFREYTLRELKDYAAHAGLTVEASFYGNYFDYRYRAHATEKDVPPRRVLGLLNLGYRLLPGPLKPGITLVLRRP